MANEIDVVRRMDEDISGVRDASDDMVDVFDQLNDITGNRDLS